MRCRSLSLSQMARPFSARTPRPRGKRAESLIVAPRPRPAGRRHPTARIGPRGFSLHLFFPEHFLILLITGPLRPPSARPRREKKMLFSSGARLDFLAREARCKLASPVGNLPIALWQSARSRIDDEILEITTKSLAYFIFARQKDGRQRRVCRPEHKRNVHSTPNDGI
jgi:hypothetical protein